VADPAALDVSDHTFTIAADPTIVKGPYLVWPAETAMTVMWETSVETPSLLQYGDLPVPVVATSPDPCWIHAVTITGLTPGTVYPYRVSRTGSDDRWTEWYTFATAPPAAGSFRFGVCSDTQEYPARHASVAASLAAGAPDVVIHAGDCVALGRDYDAWGPQFFEPAQPYLHWKPVVPVPGNHEYLGPGPFWLHRYFPPAGEGSWFAFTYGCARFIGLDSNKPFEPGSPQHDWLMRELVSPEFAAAAWRIAYLHYPPYSCAIFWGDTQKVVEHLVPLFEGYGVDLVFSGHVHVYERYYNSGVH
jgi:acid phosphatase type 7